jgi:aerobic carbon-monoxide dehydrogenase small subunit
MTNSVILRVNGNSRRVTVEGSETLLDVLRDQLGLTGAKRGCNQGVCGSCTVLVDGKAARSCLFLAALSEQSEIVTVEGLAAEGKLSPVQQAFVDSGAVQCGFCMPGMVIAATALLAGTADPTDEEIRTGLAGNLCRCSGYVKAAAAVRLAAGNKDIQA